MSQNTLNEKLHLFYFETDSSASGLLFVKSDYSGDANVSFDEVLILDCAQSLGATAVYFRRIEGRSSIPQLFIFDNSDDKLSADDLIDIHRKLWSSGIVPLYYVFDKTEVRIFNCRKSIDKKTLKPKELTKLPFDENSLLFVSDVHAKYEKYSAKLFQNGSFWEAEENKKHFNINDSSYKKLIEGLKRIRDEFAQGQNEKICNKLLVLSILVKYLEERKDSDGKQVLSSEYFKEYGGATCFCDILRKKKCIRFFEDLGKEVNGKIFELTTQEKKEIKSIDLVKLAYFLDAKTDKDQLVFWKLYDFNYLPVELISRIYEEFVPKRKDITYTPAHLVSFMVDECMPITAPQKNFKLIEKVYHL